MAVPVVVVAAEVVATAGAAVVVVEVAAVLEPHFEVDAGSCPAWPAGKDPARVEAVAVAETIEFVEAGSVVGLAGLDWHRGDWTEDFGKMTGATE